MIKKIYKFAKIFTLLLIVFTAVSAEASFVDDAYRNLKTLDRSKTTGRSAYLNIAESMYMVYSNNPNGQDADKALLASARAFKASNDRYRVRSDLDRALKNYRILQNSYSSDASKSAYLECADIYLNLKDVASSKFILNKLVNKHSKSDEANKAKLKLATIAKTYPSAGIGAAPKTKINKAPEQSVDNIKTVLNQNALLDDHVKTMPEPKEEVKTGTVVINGVRYFSDKDYTRVVIDISETAKYESMWIKEDPTNKRPPRLAIDIPSSSLGQDLKKDLTIKDGLLSSVRVGYHAPEKRTRIVLDSENVKDFTVFQMPNPNRIVVDVFSVSRKDQHVADQIAQIQKPIQTPVPQKKEEVKKPTVKDNTPDDDNDNMQMTLGSALGLKIKTIVIDAGHGGKDPGAMYGKLREKDVVLDIALELRELLKKDKSLTIYMTRDRDIFIPLEERTAIANKHKADLFISVHANAARNSKASGVETFVFNVTNDKAALEVASFENQATTKSISDLQGILKDILKYSKLEESLSLAGSVQKSLVKEVGLTKAQNLGVKQAPFYVLVGATMPSILVETGFLSNSNDATKLSSDRYRKDVAEGIYKGISSYISKYNR